MVHWRCFQLMWLSLALQWCMIVRDPLVQWLVQRFRSERLRIRSWRSATFTPSTHVRRQSFPLWPPTLNKIPLPLLYVRWGTMVQVSQNLHDRHNSCYKKLGHCVTVCFLGNTANPWFDFLDIFDFFAPWYTVKLQTFVRYPFSYFWLVTGSYELIFVLSRVCEENDVESQWLQSKKNFHAIFFFFVCQYILQGWPDS